MICNGGFSLTVSLKLFQLVVVCHEGFSNAVFPAVIPARLHWSRGFLPVIYVEAPNPSHRGIFDDALSVMGSLNVKSSSNFSTLRSVTISTINVKFFRAECIMRCRVPVDHSG